MNAGLDGRYMARAAVVMRNGSRTLSQRFLDFETFDTEAEATARAQAGAPENRRLGENLS
jgi:hypothetical protein